MVGSYMQVYVCICKTVGAWYCLLGGTVSLSYLLVLSDSLLLLLDPSEFQCIRSVSPRDNVVLRAVCTADLTARPRWFVYVSAGRARPTLT